MDINKKIEEYKQLEKNVTNFLLKASDGYNELTQTELDNVLEQVNYFESENSKFRGEIFEYILEHDAKIDIDDIRGCNRTIIYRLTMLRSNFSYLKS